MSDTRRADPTLDAWNHYGDEWQPGVVGVERHFPRLASPTATAHLRAQPDEKGREAACGARYDVILYSSEARWFAVPCRECFPQAPPPGHEADCPGVFCSAVHPGLAWQLGGSDE